MSLSETIKLTRQKALLNQEEFAAELKVSLASITRWEGGKGIPNISAMKSIKNFCKENDLPYEPIESEWLKPRMETKK